MITTNETTIMSPQVQENITTSEEEEFEGFSNTSETINTENQTASIKQKQTTMPISNSINTLQNAVAALVNS